METTWGPSGDDGGMMGRCGDDMWRPQTMETIWGPSGDDVGTTGMMRGQQGPRGDNKITKNAITFERIEIIEFHLKIWDP